MVIWNGDACDIRPKSGSMIWFQNKKKEYARKKNPKFPIILKTTNKWTIKKYMYYCAMEQQKHVFYSTSGHYIIAKNTIVLLYCTLYIIYYKIYFLTKYYTYKYYVQSTIYLHTFSPPFWSIL